MNDDENGACIVNKRTDHRIQNAGHCQNDRNEIERHGKSQVDFDRAHHLMGECYQMGQLFYLIVHQCNIGGIHRNVTACSTHRNADIGFFQGRGIVDTIADHTNGLLLCLIVSDVIQFIFRQTVGVNFRDVQLVGNAVGCVLVVTRQQDRINAQCMESGDRIRAFRAQRIRKDNIAQRLFPLRQKNHRAALVPGRHKGSIVRNRKMMFFQQCRISGKNRFSGYLSCYAAARNDLEIGEIMGRL